MAPNKKRVLSPINNIVGLYSRNNTEADLRVKMSNKYNRNYFKL